jgi:hypothetical protein
MYSILPAISCGVFPHVLRPHLVCLVFLFGRVADPGCLFRILTFIHPGSRILDLDLGFLIPDSTTATKEEGEKLVVRPFFVASKFKKLKKV